MDMQILRQLFGHTAEAARLIGDDQVFIDQLKTTSSRLAPHKVGKGGQLQERQEDWDLEAPELFLITDPSTSRQSFPEHALHSPMTAALHLETLGHVRGAAREGYGENK
jgi:hypothetical protein